MKFPKCPKKLIIWSFNLINFLNNYFDFFVFQKLKIYDFQTDISYNFSLIISNISIY